MLQINQGGEAAIIHAGAIERQIVHVAVLHPWVLTHPALNPYTTDHQDEKTLYFCRVFRVFNHTTQCRARCAIHCIKPTETARAGLHMCQLVI